MTCPKCGLEIGDAKFCPECGKKMAASSAKQNKINKKMVIGLLAIFVVIATVVASVCVLGPSKSSTQSASDSKYEKINEKERNRAKVYKTGETAQVGNNFKVKFISSKVLGKKAEYKETNKWGQSHVYTYTSSSDSILCVTVELQNITGVDVDSFRYSGYLEKYINFEIETNGKYLTKCGEMSSESCYVTPLQTVTLPLYFPISNALLKEADSIVLYVSTASDEEHIADMDDSIGLNKTGFEKDYVGLDVKLPS